MIRNTLNTREDPSDQDRQKIITWRPLQRRGNYHIKI
jgi:hypothetical protein